MSDRKFTPGPWKVMRRANQLGTRSIVVVSPVKGNTPVHIGDFAPTPEGEANARLIAAAPELYEALRKIADNYGGCHCCPHCISELALAKAEAPK